MHIALFGGRFDPPHRGHEAITNYIIKTYPHIDQVWYLPAKTHPWRPIIASEKQRVTMLGFLQKEKVFVNEGEINKQEDTYTIDTIRFLQKTTPHTYIWICGSDQLPDLIKWKDYDELITRVNFLVIPRKGHSIPKIPYTSYLLDQSFPPLDYASTVIRERVKNGLPIDHLVSKSIENYIIEQKLYR